MIPYLGFVMGRRYDTAKQSKKESMLRIVTEDLESEFATLAPNYLAITQAPGFIDVRQFLSEGYDARIHFSYLIDLTPPLSEIWNGFSSNLRTKLRKVEKYGYRLEKSTDISIFYSTVAERFSDPDINIPMISQAYFEDLFRAYPGELGLYYLYDAEGAVTGVQATQEYKVFTLWMGAPKMTAMPGNEFLQWLLPGQAKSEGYRQMENIGANNENLNLFKSKFNPSLTLFLELRGRTSSAGLHAGLQHHREQKHGQAQGSLVYRVTARSSLLPGLFLAFEPDQCRRRRSFDEFKGLGYPIGDREAPPGPLPVLLHEVGSVIAIRPVPGDEDQILREVRKECLQMSSSPIVSVPVLFGGLPRSFRL
jgi:hypothetical protein